jgi:hypothetical protein
MRSLQKKRWETAMAVFHSDPIVAYEAAIQKHLKAIQRITFLIKKLKESQR